MTAQYCPVRYLGENWKREQSYDLSAFVTKLKKVCEEGKTLCSIKKKVTNEELVITQPVPWNETF